MAEGSRDYWRIKFEFQPIAQGDSLFMNDAEVKQLLKSLMGVIKPFSNNAKKWHLLKRNYFDSVPVSFTPSSFENALKLAAMYDSFGKLAADNLGYLFKLFTLDDQEEKLNVELRLGGDVGSIQRGELTFRFGTSWETLLYKSDCDQFMNKLLARFNLNTLFLDSSVTRNHFVGNVHYYSKLNSHEILVYLKKHFKIVNETEQGMLVEFSKINKKNRTLDVLQLPHVQKLYDMLHEQFENRYKARFS